MNTQNFAKLMQEYKEQMNMGDTSKSAGQNTVQSSGLATNQSFTKE